jgi:hypothetical protein
MTSPDARARAELLAFPADLGGAGVGTRKSEYNAVVGLVRRAASQDRVTSSGVVAALGNLLKDLPDASASSRDR